MNILAIVPARGGSKSVPRKNIRPLLGKPLIAWIIGEAHRSRLITRTIVSTDDAEIAAVARAYGAEVPFLRPIEISDDMSLDIEFMLHALQWLNDHERYQPEIIVRLPPTSPLCSAELIDQGIQKLLDTPEADAVRPIVEVSKHPYKMWRISSDGQWLEPFLPKEITGFDEPHDLPRQLFPRVYSHTGAMDVMRFATVYHLRSKIGQRLAYFIMRPEEAINIDDEVDFALAEFFLRRRLAGTAGGGG